MFFNKSAISFGIDESIAILIVSVEIDNAAAIVATKANTGITWTYKSPSITTPYYYTTSASGTTITLNNSAEVNTATTNGKCDGITLTASNDNLNNTANVSENEYNKENSI